jgi:hypothetical protein
LTRFPETSEKVHLQIRVLRLFVELQLVPTLSSSPSPSFAMLEDLLIDVQDMELSRYSFDAIWLVDLRIYLLKPLEQFVWIFAFVFHLSDVLFPVEQSSSI